DDQTEHGLIAEPSGVVHDVTMIAPNPRDTVIASYSSRPVGMAGFYTADDNFRHAIVGLADKTVHEIFYHAGVGVFDSVIASYSSPRIVSVAGFVSTDDNVRHALIALRDGSVHDVFFGSGTGIHDQVIKRYPRFAKGGSIFTPAPPPIGTRVASLSGFDSDGI